MLEDGVSHLDPNSAAVLAFFIEVEKCLQNCKTDLIRTHMSKVQSVHLGKLMNETFSQWKPLGTVTLPRDFRLVIFG